MFHNREEFFEPPISKQDLEKTYDCDMCECGDWYSETEVEIHKKTVHRKELQKRLTKDDVCMACGKKCDCPEAVIAHIKTTHFLSSSTAGRIEREIFVCHYCQNVFFNKDLLAIHIVHRHGNKVYLPCPKCPLLLKPSRQYLHLSNKHEFQSVSLCPLCLSKRPGRAELQRHVAAAHARKHYHCTVCGYVATKKRDFNLHLERYRARQYRGIPKNYEHCFVPSRAKVRPDFTRIRPFLNGVAIPRPLFVCVLCREICEADDMREHVARVHTSVSLVAEKSKHCCSCGEQFDTRIMLKHHVFKLKGDHEVLEAGMPPKVEAETPTAAKAEGEGAGDDGCDDVGTNVELRSEATEDSDDDQERQYILIVAEDEEELENPALKYEVSVECEYEDEVKSETISQDPKETATTDE